jgi:hypothetical protein
MNHSQRRKQLSQPTHTSLLNPRAYNLQLETVLRAEHARRVRDVRIEARRGNPEQASAYAAWHTSLTTTAAKAASYRTF